MRSIYAVRLAIQLAPVELINRGVKTVVEAIQMNRFTNLRGMPHRFLRHAAHVNTGARPALWLR